MALGAALFVLEEGAGEVINSFLLRRRGATRARAQRPNCVLRLFVYQTDRKRRVQHLPRDAGVCFVHAQFSLSVSLVRNAPLQSD
jgi:hypothetical protein